MSVKSLFRGLAMALAICTYMLAGWDLSAQEVQHKIMGCVYDEDKTPMAGVGVVIVGTLNGVVTDVDGNYAIAASKGQVLQFSFLGYKTESVTVEDKNVIKVVDAEENPDLTQKLGVQKAPTLLVPTKNGVKVYDNASEIKRFIEGK